MTTFSPDRLREARLAAGMTPEALAVALGMSSFSTREWERGRVTPRTAIVGRLADALGCPVADLFTANGGDGDAAA